MKKIIIGALCLLCLSACASTGGKSSISNGSDVIFEGPTTYTKADLYEVLKVSSEDAVLNDIIEKIAIAKGIDMEDIETSAEETVQMYVDYGYESYIVYYYGSVDAFKKNYITSGILTELCEDYVTSNLDEFVAEDNPVLMQMASFDSEETANKVIEEVEAGGDFETVVQENGYAYDCPMEVYIDSDSLLSIDVKSYLNSTDTTGLSSIITTTTSAQDADGNITSTSTYYLLNIESRDYNDFKEDYIALKADSIDSDDVKNALLTQYEIKFYDQDIYKLMSDAYEVLK